MNDDEKDSLERRVEEEEEEMVSTRSLAVTNSGVEVIEGEAFPNELSNNSNNSETNLSEFTNEQEEKKQQKEDEDEDVGDEENEEDQSIPTLTSRREEEELSKEVKEELNSSGLPNLNGELSFETEKSSEQSPAAPPHSHIDRKHDRKKEWRDVEMEWKQEMLAAMRTSAAHTQQEERTAKENSSNNSTELPSPNENLHSSTAKSGSRPQRHGKKKLDDEEIEWKQQMLVAMGTATTQRNQEEKTQEILEPIAQKVIFNDRTLESASSTSETRRGRPNKREGVRWADVPTEISTNPNIPPTSEMGADTSRNTSPQTDPQAQPSSIILNPRQRSSALPPGAYAVRGRAAGQFPTWGRTLNLNPSSSSSSSRGRTSRRAGFLTFLSTRMQSTRSSRFQESAGTTTVTDAEAIIYADVINADDGERPKVPNGQWSAFQDKKLFCLIIFSAAGLISLAIFLSALSPHNSNNEDTPPALPGYDSPAPELDDNEWWWTCVNDDPNSNSTDPFPLLSSYTEDDKRRYSDLNTILIQKGLYRAQLTADHDPTECNARNRAITWMAFQDNWYRSLPFEDLKLFNVSKRILQRYTLANFYFAANFDPSLERTWLQDVDECEWGEAIKCSEENVEVLKLSGQHLRGVIPTELGFLSSLRSIDLRSNELMSTIPTEIGNLQLLLSLFLSGNSLIGTIPDELGNISPLDYLDLAQNELDGTIPSSLGSLTKLTRLHLQDNRLMGPIPAEFDQLESIVNMDLRGNNLTGTIPDALCFVSARREDGGICETANVECSCCKRCSY